MKVLAIDIGFHNMGLVLPESLSGPKITVEFLKKVSLEDYKYIKSNDFVDTIPLFVEDHQSIFDSADKILRKTTTWWLSKYRDFITLHVQREGFISFTCEHACAFWDATFKL